MSNDMDSALLGMDLERLRELLKKFAEHYEENRIIIPPGPSTEFLSERKTNIKASSRVYENLLV